jgi:hypothetical protein
MKGFRPACIVLILIVRIVPSFGEKSGEEFENAGRMATHGPDVVILHPPSGFELSESDTLVVAAYISAFCVEKLGTELLGIQLFINGMLAVQHALQVHGNDGDAQYHIFVPNLTPGKYELKAVPWAPGNAVDHAIVTITVVSREEFAEKQQRLTQEQKKHTKRCWGRTDDDWTGRFTQCQAYPTSEASDEWCNISCAQTQYISSDTGPCSHACSGHGVHLPGNDCLCYGDWFGEKCELNVYSTSAFVPRTLDMSCLGSHRRLGAARMIKVSEQPRAMRETCLFFVFFEKKKLASE